MILTVQISVVCIAAGGCTAAQIAAAPLQASVGGRTFKVEASNRIRDELRRNRFAPVRVEAELAQGADGFKQGRIAISAILSAPTQLAVIPAIGGVVSTNRPPPPPPVQLRPILERGSGTAAQIVAMTATEKAQLQLSITPQRAQTMMLTAPRGDAAPPNDSRGFIHKKIGGFIGTAVSTIFPPIAPVINVARTFVGGGGGGSVACAPGFQRGPDGNCIRSGVTGAIERFLPGGATGIQPILAGSGCPSGMHPNRSSYFTQSEGFIQKGTKCVSNRRRNPLNPRAARRSMSRLTALSKEMGRLEKTLKRIAPRR